MLGAPLCGAAADPLVVADGVAGGVDDDAAGVLGLADEVAGWAVEG